jgi:hypothetical protein
VRPEASSLSFSAHLDLSHANPDCTPAGVHVGAREVDAFTGFLSRLVSAFADLSSKRGPEKARISERPALTRDFRRVDSEPLSYHDIA